MRKTLPALIRRLFHVLAGVVVVTTAFVAIGYASATVAAAATTPVVDGVQPNTGLTTGGTAITVIGSGFVSGATVVIGQGNGTIGAIPATNVDVVSPTQITAVTGGGAKPGSFSLFVTTSGGTSGGSVKFIYTVPPPAVTNVSPNSGPISGGTAITINGSNFATDATVAIGQGNGSTGAIAATSVDVVTPTEITATTGGGAKPGMFSVYVTTAGGTSLANSYSNFTYSNGVVPTITAISPNTGPTTGGTPITITGTGFLSGATVAIGQGNGTTGAIAATNVDVVSSTEITATTGGPALPGVFSPFVTTSGGTSASNNGPYFTYSPAGAAPTVTNVSPNKGGQEGGTAITVTGTGFTSAASVRIGQGDGTVGAIPATNVVVVSSTEITATTGTKSGGATPGTFTLYVTSSGGTTAPNAGADFTYTTVQVTPDVRSISPNSGPASGGTSITILGSGFDVVNGVQPTVAIGQGNGITGAIPATNVVLVGSGEITATTGGGAKAGTFTLYVTTFEGTSPGSTQAHFTYTG